MDSVALAVPHKTARTTSGRKRVLIVRMDAIGDYILWRNAAERLISDYASRGYETVLLANSMWAELAQKDLLPHEVWKINVKQFATNPLYRFRYGLKLANGNFNTVINPAYSRSFVLSDSAVRMSSARTRLGSAGDEASIIPALKKVSDRWYTRIFPSAKASVMELSRNAEFMRQLGYKDFIAEMPRFNPRVIEQPEELSGQRYVVLFPGASWAGRQWPTSHFADVARRAYKETGVITVICGGPAEVSLSDALASMLDVPCINLTGKTSLCQLIGAIKNAVAVVSNETSAAHIAAAVDTPVVCVLGGGHFGRFMPYQLESSDSKRALPVALFKQMPCFNCDWECPYLAEKDTQGSPAPCIEAISVDSIYAELLRCISLPANVEKAALNLGGT